MLKSLLILLNFSSQYSGVLQKEILTLFTYLNLVLAASQTKKNDGEQWLFPEIRWQRGEIIDVRDMVRVIVA